MKQIRKEEKKLNKFMNKVQVDEEDEGELDFNPKARFAPVIHV